MAIRDHYGKKGGEKDKPKHGGSTHERHAQERGEAHGRHAKARDSLNKQHEEELAQMNERHMGEMGAEQNEMSSSPQGAPAPMNTAGAGAANGTSAGVAGANAA